ncbi:MAG: NHL repeat-containing protein [Lachnospiraceae bacterium]|nr:NHL repeat-containing protein [Lachnospiraceae bacterium]
MAGKRVMKTIRAAACAVAAFTLTAAAMSPCMVYADVPYDTYSYNYWGDDVLQPHAYLYTETLTSASFGTALTYPEDLFIHEDLLYVADTGNSRILKMDSEGTISMEITFARDESDLLNGPKGVYVTEEGHIYVADSGNERIVEFDEDGEFLREIKRPETDLITESQKFVPTKVVVDNAGRIYAICYGINMGLVEFDRHGEFQGFMGATEVSVSPFEYMWKNYFSTEAQQERMETIVPTEYSNIFVDQENFIYATINNLASEDYASGADTIRRLNPTGTDVLRRLGNYPINGDLYSADEDAKWSSFCDVASTEYGCYFILDSAGGKIFAYDYDGNSLFIFGQNGSREGNTQKPVSLGLSGDESQIYVLDNLQGSILKFEITAYGQHVLDALALNNIGDSEGSYAEWQEVLKQNANNELAYVGIGKIALAEGEYKEAMNCFELGNSKKYYNKAFYYYRKELMESGFGKLMAAVGGVVLLVLVIRWAKKLKRWAGEVRCTMSRH